MTALAAKHIVPGIHLGFSHFGDYHAVAKANNAQGNDEAEYQHRIQITQHYAGFGRLTAKEDIILEYLINLVERAVYLLLVDVVILLGLEELAERK